MIRVAVTGAAGRMGRLMVKNIIEDSETELVQAYDIREVGKDAGELAGIGKVGVQILDAREINKTLDSEVLVDFTTPEGAVENIKAASNKNVKLVVGTTGFNEEQKKIIEECAKKVPTVLTPNFSVGVNVFWKIVELAAKYFKDYDIEIYEIHHRFKKDAPSGTALKIANVIKEVLGEDREIIHGRQGLCPRGKEIAVMAIRGGDVVGEHTVLFLGMGERLEITHRAHSRQAFASGAMKAIKWVYNVVKPGLYTMDDVLGFRNEKKE